MISPGTLDEVLAIARTATNIFASYGLKCCMTGGVASALYGVPRCPNDVDIVVLTKAYSQEALYQLLTEKDKTFFSVPSKNPMATYRVLWYRLSLGRQCKVDILTPGIMDIPDVPLHHIETIRSIPVMPFIPQLLLKLQAWADHRVAWREYLRVKQHVDVADLRQLLRAAQTRGENIGRSSSAWVPRDFIQAAQRRVLQYVVMFPETRSSWKSVGFKVESVEAGTRHRSRHVTTSTLRYN